MQAQPLKHGKQHSGAADWLKARGAPRRGRRSHPGCPTLIQQGQVVKVTRLFHHIVHLHQNIGLVCHLLSWPSVGALHQSVTYCPGSQLVLITYCPNNHMTSGLVYHLLP